MYKIPECCLRPNFARKVVSIFPDAASMRDDQEFCDMILAWSRHGRLCNMHMERLLAYVKKAAPAINGRRPTVQRVAAAGLASAWLRSYIEAGYRGPSQITRQWARQEGAPLAANPERKCKPQMLRPHLLYANEKLSEERRRRGGAAIPRQEARQTRARACAEFA